MRKERDRAENPGSIDQIAMHFFGLGLRYQPPFSFEIHLAGDDRFGCGVISNHSAGWEPVPFERGPTKRLRQYDNFD